MSLEKWNGTTVVFDFVSAYSGAYFFINATRSSTLALRFSSFVKTKTKFFVHLYTSKVSTKTYTYDSTMWCVRVCICYVGWQNTSYTVDTACTPSLSGLATAINRCTLHFHCEMPPWDSRLARTALFFKARWTQQAKSSVRVEFPSERRLADKDDLREHWRWWWPRFFDGVVRARDWSLLEKRRTLRNWGWRWGRAL